MYIFHAFVVTLDKISTNSYLATHGPFAIAAFCQHFYLQFYMPKHVISLGSQFNEL